MPIPGTLKKVKSANSNVAILIFLWVSDRYFQLYFCRADFASETISVSIAAAPSQSSAAQIPNLAILIFPWVSDRSFQIYFCRYDFASEPVSVSIYFS
jgi:hypothetical protein